jgi:TP901 family phage tail tape measure protein
MARDKLEIEAKIIDNMSKSLAKIEASLAKTNAKVKDSSTAFLAAGQAVAQLGQMVNSSMQSSIQQFASFDQAMKNVQAITKISNDELEKLTMTARDMAKETGQSAETVAEGFFNLASSGKNVTEMLDIMPVAAKLAVAGNSDIATSSKALVSALAAYGIEASKANEVADLMVLTANKGQTTFNEFATSIGVIGPVAKANAVAFADVNAAWNTLRATGMEAARANTGLRNVLVKIQGVSTEAQEAMSQYGLEVARNADGTLNFFGSLQNLKQVYDNLGPSQERTILLSKIFGQENIASAETLIQSANSLDAYSAELSKAGALQDTFNIQSEGTSIQLKKLQEDYGDQQRMLAEEMLPAQIMVMNAQIGLFNAFNSMPGPLGTYLGATLLIVGALSSMIAPLIMLIPLLQGTAIANLVSATATKIHTAAQVMLGRAMAMTNIQLLIMFGAVIALVFLTYILIKNWDKVTAGAIAFANAFVVAINWILQAINILISAISFAASLVGQDIDYEVPMISKISTDSGGGGNTTNNTTNNNVNVTTSPFDSGNHEQRKQLGEAVSDEVAGLE